MSKESVLKQTSRGRAAVTASQQKLGRHAESGRRREFFEVLRPLLSYLRDHARRELRLLEIEGTLHKGEVTVTDLLDDVIVRAWERYAQRPRDMGLDLWLIQLLHESLDAWIKQKPRSTSKFEKAAEEALPHERLQVDDQEWWLWLLGEDEQITLHDVIPDHQAETIQQRIETEDLKDRLLSWLSELPKEARQAFVLHVLENYAPAEIAKLQNRSEFEVRADIEATRSALRKRLQDAFAPAGQEH
jgi:RNA polymerase sigma factor (sigma-70 family)